MAEINLKKTVSGKMEDVIPKLTELLKTEGFGILTRIDFHDKIKEKLGKDIAPAVILGACNPKIAYEAYLKNTDVASLIPCNAVVRDVGHGKVSVELMKPSAMMKMLGEEELECMAQDADAKLKGVLDRL